MPVFSPVGWLLKGKSAKKSGLTDTGMDESAMEKDTSRVGYVIKNLEIDFTSSKIPFKFTNNGPTSVHWDELPSDFSDVAVYMKMPTGSGGWTNYYDTGFVVDLSKSGEGHQSRSMSNFDSASLVKIENASKIYACFKTKSGKYIAAKSTTPHGTSSDIDFEVSIKKRNRQRPH